PPVVLEARLRDRRIRGQRVRGAPHEDVARMAPRPVGHERRLAVAGERERHVRRVQVDAVGGRRGGCDGERGGQCEQEQTSHLQVGKYPVRGLPKPSAWVDSSHMRKRLSIVAFVAMFALALAGGASAAQLIDRNATGVKLAVNAKGEAMLTYRAAGQLKHVLVW